MRTQEEIEAKQSELIKELDECVNVILLGELRAKLDTLEWILGPYDSDSGMINEL